MAIYKKLGDFNDVLEYYQPTMFVFENVLGLLSAKGGDYLKNMQKRFQEVGYRLDMKVLTASDYGVLQNRKRVILIGKKHSIQEHFRFPEIPERNDLFSDYKVRDLLCDLPPLQPGEEKNEYKSLPTRYLLDSGIREFDDILTWHIARPNREQDRDIYRYVIKAWNENKTIL